MKIIHISDLHLDSPLGTRLPESKARERAAELNESFRRICEEAVRIDAKAIIIAGDLFDAESISFTSIDRFNTIILSYPKIKFLYLTGNHDSDGYLKGIGTPPENLYVFGDGWTYFGAKDVTIAGRGALSADMFDTLSLDERKKNIVVLHGALGAHFSSSADGIGLKEAAGKNIDYMALGHYHTYSARRIDTRGVAVYSGTPEGRGFDEAGPKGYVVIDTDGEAVTHTFVPFARRYVLELEADISTALSSYEVEGAVSRALGMARECDIVRVTVTGQKEPELSLDLDAIRARWADEYYYFEIRDRSRLKINPEDYRLDRTLKGEFIRLVYAREDLTPELKDKVIRLGLDALMNR